MERCQIILDDDAHTVCAPQLSAGSQPPQLVTSHTSEFRAQDIIRVRGAVRRGTRKHREDDKALVRALWHPWIDAQLSSSVEIQEELHFHSKRTPSEVKNPACFRGREKPARTPTLSPWGEGEGTVSRRGRGGTEATERRHRSYRAKTPE